MKYVLMFCGDEAQFADIDPEITKKTYEDVFAWFTEHSEAGRIANGGAELQPSSTATTVRAGNDGEPVMVDGPFTESKEVVGGFTLIDVPDLDAALAMARTWPPLRYPGASVEVRPIIDHDEG
ncbi:MAG: YciI family protein [Nocardioidaceae bacterium]